MAGVRYTVETSGLFFRNPVGQLHRNIYDVLEDVADAGANAAAAQLSPGRGLVTGALRDSIEARLVKASRYNTWTGRARVIAGAKGSWAPGRGLPEKRNRAAAATVQRKHRWMYRAAALLKVTASDFGARLIKGLT